ncbi:MAG: ABC transporter ATP-binding protein [Lautropia sp.]|nr:ABC transporter ATP-binding protein [Lautropia sp.]
MPAATSPVVLEARQVSWQARQKTIVQDVSVSVRAGEMLGLIGPNGSGKSTLLRLLAGLLPPSRGDVLINGRPMKRMPRRELAHLLALVSQSADTQEAITVRDAVELGRTPWLSALQGWSDQDDRIVQDALQAVGMQDRGAQIWHQLSGGERQRVHIARALAQQTPILLLDEPTNHLDIHHQLSLMALVRQLHGTKVMAIHDLNQALLCDRLLVMHEGRLIAEGLPSSVLKPDLLERVFRVGVHELLDPSDGTRVLRFLPLPDPDMEPATSKQRNQSQTGHSP